MNETVQVLLTIYGVVAGILLGLGMLYFADNYTSSQRSPASTTAQRTRIGARLMTLAPVWPLVVPLVVVKALLYWVPIIWKEAWS